MKATARRLPGATYTHRVQIRDHRLGVDESGEAGGADEGPSPQELLAASLASCTAMTMEMYAARKGWDIGEIEVVAQYRLAPRGEVTQFSLELRLPAGLSEEQLRRLRVIAGKCPVHRTLAGEVAFNDRVTLIGGAREGGPQPEREPR